MKINSNKKQQSTNFVINYKPRRANSLNLMKIVEENVGKKGVEKW